MDNYDEESSVDGMGVEDTLSNKDDEIDSSDSKEQSSGKHGNSESEENGDLSEDGYDIQTHGGGELEEVEGFNVVKAILRQKLCVSRVTARDTQSYFGIQSMQPEKLEAMANALAGIFNAEYHEKVKAIGPINLKNGARWVLGVDIGREFYTVSSAKSESDRFLLEAKPLGTGRMEDFRDYLYSLIKR